VIQAVSPVESARKLAPWRLSLEGAVPATVATTLLIQVVTIGSGNILARALGGLWAPAG
jgi:hypothetical protein